jgi:hypothetical protein
MLDAVEAVEVVFDFVRTNHDSDGSQLRKLIPKKVNYVVISFRCVDDANQVTRYVYQNENDGSAELY